MPADATVRLLRQPPVLRVVRGEPTAEELAALIAVVCARVAGGATVHRPRSAWSAPDRLLRRPVAPGRDGWRRSSIPG
jgi:hypothetical protein